MRNQVDIVLVNWNSGPHLRRCLEAIADSPEDVSCIGRVIVVDNASSDGSERVADLAERLPLLVVANGRNAGFGAACNQGATTGSSDNVLFLNTDIEMGAGTIARAARFLADGTAARIGIVGIRMVDQNRITQSNTARFPTPSRLFAQSAGLDRIFPSLALLNRTYDHSKTGDVEQVSGAFLMIRRDLLTQLGGFDERFFVYYEEVDLCYRTAKAGWRRVHYAEVSAMHAGGGSTQSVKDIRLFYLLRSRLLYAAKHFALSGQLVVAVGTLAVEPLMRFAQLSSRRSWREVAALGRGYRLLYSSLPTLGNAAKRSQPVTRPAT